MNNSEILNIIWSGLVEQRTQGDRSPLAELLDGVLAVPTVALVARIGVDHPVAFADSSEVLPGVLLGDVIAEELNFDVPVNSVILIEPEKDADAEEMTTVKLGRDLGNVLDSVARSEVNAPSRSASNPKFDEGLINQRFIWPAHDIRSIKLRPVV